MIGRSVFPVLFGLTAALLILGAAPSRAAEGVIVTQSAHDVKTTVDRLQKNLTDKGITIFARIDHAAGAKSVGQTLRPMEVLIFGNPKLGTPLMQKNQEIGLDLPLKVLVFQAENGATQIAYADPAPMAKRYGVTEPANVLEQIAAALKSFTAAAAAK